MNNKDFNRNPFKLLAVGSLLAIGFTIIWMYGTYQLGVPEYFLLFGVAIIVIATINFIINWRRSEMHTHLQESLKAEEELAFSILEEPTFVYCYCPSCGKPIINEEDQLCCSCMGRINAQKVD